MLDVKIDRKRIQVTAMGDSDVVTIEVAQLIGSLYAQMRTEDVACAEAFRRTLLHLLADADLLVWQMDPAVGGVASVVPAGQEDE